MHLRRLLGFKQTSQRSAAITELDQHIQRRLTESGCSLADFEWADRITNLCDFIAFYFAFEELIDRTFKVFSSNQSTQETEIPVVSSLNGDIRIFPWPFSVQQYPGFIFGYALEGYPTELKPVKMPYRLINAG